jgi:pimeloyl-ACP methyl ester carboxylesterase
VNRRGALISAGVAAGAVAAGVVGSAIVRRHHRAGGPPVGDLPPNDVGPVVSFDGTELAVRAAGDPSKPVFLLAHGFSLDMSTWCDLWPELARDFRVVAFDHRSHGLSGRAKDGGLTIDAMGRDVAALLEAVSPDRPAVVVGHSMGAMAILAMAEQRPELFGARVAGVVLIGAASSNLLLGAMGSVTGLLRPRLGTLASAARRVDRLRRAVLASPADVSATIARLTQFGPDAPPHLVDHVVALAHAARPEVWRDGLAGLMEMDLRHAVPRIVVPSIVVVGEHDRVTPPAAAVELAAALPDGRLVVIEGAGHLPMLERPYEVDRELRAFGRSVLGFDRPKARARRKKEEGAA